MTLLVLDDDAAVREAVKMVLGDKYRLLLAPSFEIATSYLESEDMDGALIDINLAGSTRDGLSFLSLFKRRYPDKPALMVSGQRDVPVVVACIKAGADDYVEKPFEPATLELKVEKMFADSLRNRVYRRAFDQLELDSEIVGSHPLLLQARSLVEEAMELRILLVGETGVGKTPFARLSNRVVQRMTGLPRPFEQINCAALNSEQFQDQLFGHKKGAFTGALSDKRGLVELAKGGDLFLDEIGEMPLETQALFLTFLDSMEYYRLGDDVKRKAQVRVIAATNRNLKERVAEGKFRKDLYSRISQVVVEIPPVRERRSDIPILFDHFVQKFCSVLKPYDPQVLQTLQAQDWTDGNVREFRDAVEYLVLKSRGSTRIEMAHLGGRYRPEWSGLPVSTDRPVEGADVDATAAYERLLEEGLEGSLERVERALLQQCLNRYPGTLDEMARSLRVSRPTLYRRLKHHSLSGGELQN